MKTLFIAPVGEITSLTSISLGIIKSLEKSGLKVGFLKPLSQADNRSISVYKELFNRNTPTPISEESVETYINQGQYEQILEDIVAKVDEISQDLDVIVIEGAVPNAKNPFAYNLNIDIARTLCSGVVFSGNSGANTPKEIAEYLDIYTKLYKESCSWFAGYILNRVEDQTSIKEIINACQTSSAKKLDQLGSISNNPNLKSQQDTINFIADNLSLVSLMNHLEEPNTNRMPPSAFRYRLIEKARKANKRIVLPEGNEPRTIRAAIICAEKEIARCVLLGDEVEIKKVADEHGLIFPNNIEIINPATISNNYINQFVELRKHRGATEEIAKTSLQDNVVLGTMMLANDDVDGLVSGAIHTTADTIRPALQLIGTDKNSKIVSSIFFMLMPDQVHVYGDCAVNPSPTPEQLADIAVQSAQSAIAFGIDPKVAMISYSTGTSGAGEAVEATAKATELAKIKAPNIAIDGPLQFDTAYVPSVGKQKAPNSPVAGHATVFIFPDLNTGNTTYKAVQRSANVVSIGPMLQGLAKPVNDLSRGALVDDIVYTIAITAIQAITK